jgi:CheY-like chemotaxis protein
MGEIGTTFSLVPTLPASNSCRTLNNVPKHQFGTCFARRNFNDRAASQMASRIDGNGRKILVIDDDLAIRVLLQAVLKRMKFDVELAEDGSVGLEKLRRNGKFDLILLDLMMPKINGYEFIERVAKDFPQYQKHIIVFTAAGKRGVDKIPANTVCNSILKPFDLEKFVEMISDCLDGAHEPH